MLGGTTHVKGNVMRMSLCLAATLLVGLAGCGKEEGGGATTQSGAMPSDLGSQIGAAAGESLSKYSGELGDQQEQIKTLSASARSFGDEKLNDLLARAEQKIKELGGKLSEIKTAEEGSTKALRSEIKDLTADVQDLLAKAKERLADLQEG